MPAPARARRTQAERRAETRRKLLDATIDCLAEYGYAGMTTARVVARAGVTRGAQAHYFQTKAELVTAALRHLAVKRAEQAFDKMGTLLVAEDPIGAALDLIWDIHSGPVFTANAELWLAARTDPELRAEIAAVEPTASGAIIGFVQRFPLPKHLQREMQNFLFTAMDTVRGVMFGAYATLDDQQRDARWQRAKADLRMLAEAKIAASGLDLRRLSTIIANATPTD